MDKMGQRTKKANQLRTEQGVAEGLDDKELYGLKVGDVVKARVDDQIVQGNVIDLFPETMEVELLLRGDMAGQTITVDVRDTKYMDESGVAEGLNDQLPQDTLDLIDEYIAKVEPDADRNEMIQDVVDGYIHTSELEYALQDDNQGVAEGKDEGKPGKNFAKIAKSAAKRYGSKEAGERVAGAVRAKLAKAGKLEESVMLDESSDTLEHIISKHKHEVKKFLQTNELDDHLYDALYDYYADCGEMPYGIAKAREGDPYTWVADRFERDVHQHVKTSAIPTMKPVGNDMTDECMTTGTPGANPFDTKGPMMKSNPFESWENQLNSILNEGITVTSSTGQQGMPDSVSINATDSDAQELLSIVRSAGLGVFGNGEKPTSAYGAPMDAHGAEPEGHGAEPEASPAVVGDGDDMLALIKKMSGSQEQSSDYADEEGHEHGEEECSACGHSPCDCEGDKEEVDEFAPLAAAAGGLAADAAGTAAAGLAADAGMGAVGQQVAKQAGGMAADAAISAAAGGDDEEVEEGNAFSKAVVDAKKDGIQKGEKINVGGKEYPVKEEDEDDEETVEEEKCNECGYMESKCQCDEEQVEESFANSDDDKAMQDLQYMLDSLSGGLNGRKRSQATGNITQVTTETKLMKESNDLMIDFQKLSGIK
jgi:hypothetical protein